MSRLLQTVAEVPQFLRDIAAAGVSDAEQRAIIDAIAAHRPKVTRSVVRAACEKCGLPAGAKARAEVTE